LFFCKVPRLRLRACMPAYCCLYAQRNCPRLAGETACMQA
jgi:hypothetical protein